MTVPDPPPPTDPAAAAHLLLRALVDELVRGGVELAVISPGSRNTPIVEALAAQPGLRCFSQIDERGAGFFALGAAKLSGRPVVVTCTSGTAAANLAPAVIEAHHARVPLVVLTADRPPELREVGAGQTIDQVRLYGSAVRWFFDVGVHEAGAAQMRWMRALAGRALAAAGGPPAGPVHLNLPLREPLVLTGELPSEPGGGGRPDGRPWVSSEAGTRARSTTIPPAERPLIVAGELGIGPDAAAAGASLAGVAEQAGIPLLADPLSGARRGAAAIAQYDLILRDPPPDLNPDLVLRFGELPTSKPLRTWLVRCEADQIAFCDDGAWPDPAAVVARRVVGPVADQIVCLAESRALPGRSPAWLARWRDLDDAVARAVDATLDAEVVSEPLVARTLVTELPADATLFVASSMPIRDVEEFLPARAEPPRIVSNRGANGIDGTVSAAFGAAAVAAGPVVLLIGDVALAHDIGGLLSARRTSLSLTIVLIDNDGGGIFSFLPIAGVGAVFDDFVATPHGLPFAAACELFGCRHVAVGSVPALRDAIAAGIATDGVTLVEVRTDRAENRRLHARVADAAREAQVGPRGPGNAPRDPDRDG